MVQHGGNFVSSDSLQCFNIMCGICCCIYLDRGNSERSRKVIEDSIFPYLQRRGPDHVNNKECSADISQETVQVTFVGTVLHLRGQKTPQPLEDELGNILLWNGEIFGGIQVKENENDSEVLLKTLGNCSSDVSPSQHLLSTVAKVQGPWSFVYWQASEKKLWFGRDYFGRRSLLWHLPSTSEDLLVITSVSERNSSAADPSLHMEEIPADGVYCVNCANDQMLAQPFKVTKYGWTMVEDITKSDEKPALFLLCPVPPFNTEKPSLQNLLVINENRRKLSLQLNGRETYQKHGNDIADKGWEPEKNCNILDDSILQGSDGEYATERLSSMRSGSHLGPCVMNGSFPNWDSVQVKVCNSCTTSKQTGELSQTLSVQMTEPQRLEPTNENHNQNLGACLECFKRSSSRLLSPGIPKDTELSPNFNISCDELTLHRNPDSTAVSCYWQSVYRTSQEMFINVLGEAVRKRVFNLPRTDRNPSIAVSSQAPSSGCGMSDVTPVVPASFAVQDKHSHVGILFSGGIDSMMIALLADRCVPSGEPIDLINVAFEQKTPKPNLQKKGKSKRKQSQPVSKDSSTDEQKDFTVPDRLTGISGLQELQSLNPLRQWNFIEVDVTAEELQEMRSRYISHLVSPLNTVLDDSIGCALWFAARGTGMLCSRATYRGDHEDTLRDILRREYTSSAKVLLVGMGADEQLGGYARHRTRFINEGWSGLMEEMEMEVKRISKRNLGRDDRCISDHGREARFPFLDEAVVSFLNSLPVWVKTDPSLPRGTGEKLLLRQAARLLGLMSSSELPKRAIQFGSRIAKLESPGEKGNESCSRLAF